MEKMPYQELPTTTVRTTVRESRAGVHATSDWQRALPVLAGGCVTLRELRADDAPSLLAMLSTEEVTRLHFATANDTRWIRAIHCVDAPERAAGNYVCFGIVPRGMHVAVGLIQVRKLEPAVHQRGVGIHSGIRFLGDRSLHRGCGAGCRLRFRSYRRASARGARDSQKRPRKRSVEKAGRHSGGHPAASFLRDGEYLDQVLWTIVDDEWRRSRPAHVPRVH